MTLIYWFSTHLSIQLYMYVYATNQKDNFDKSCKPLAWSLGIKRSHQPESLLEGLMKPWIKMKIWLNWCLHYFFPYVDSSRYWLLHKLSLISLIPLHVEQHAILDLFFECLILVCLIPISYHTCLHDPTKININIQNKGKLERKNSITFRLPLLLWSTKTFNLLCGYDLMS